MIWLAPRLGQKLQLASDLREALPDMRGFSSRNIWEMRRFYIAYAESNFLSQAVRELSRERDSSILQQPVAELATAKTSKIIEILRQLVAEIPWGHHLLLLDKIKDPAARLYYLRATAQLGWSRNILLNQIKAHAYERAVKEKIKT